MKTLREYIDQLDEISRRDFLKGAGAAAVGAAIGQPKDAEAEWTQPFVSVDQMTGKTHIFYKNISADRTANLLLVKKGNEYVLPELNLFQGTFNRRAPYGTSDIWIDEEDRQFIRSDQDYRPGRMRIDANKVFPILFAFPYESNTTAVIMPVGSENIPNAIASARERILIDTGPVSDRGVIQFDINPPQQQKKQRESQELEESEPLDPIQKIDRLFKNK
jgi:hypothetical protein